MSLFAEIHPLFPEKQGIGARTGRIWEVLKKKAGDATNNPPILWCLAKSLMSHNVPDRNKLFAAGGCPSGVFLHP